MRRVKGERMIFSQWKSSDVDGGCIDFALGAVEPGGVVGSVESHGCISVTVADLKSLVDHVERLIAKHEAAYGPSSVE